MNDKKEFEMVQILDFSSSPLRGDDIKKVLEKHGWDFCVGFAVARGLVMQEAIPQTLNFVQGVHFGVLSMGQRREDFDHQFTDYAEKFNVGQQVIYKRYNEKDFKVFYTDELVTVKKIHASGHVTVNDGKRNFSVMGKNLRPIEGDEVQG